VRGPALPQACPVTALQVEKQRGTYARVIDERRASGARNAWRHAGSIFGLPARGMTLRITVRSSATSASGTPVREVLPLGVLRVEKSDRG